MNGIWHPFAQMKDFKPKGVVTKARGAWLHLSDGRRVLDGISSWWVNVLGHAHPEIAEAISRQAALFDQVIVADFSHEPMIELVGRLQRILPAGLTRVFFSDNGSTSVEVGLKMALQAQSQKGESRRTRFVAFHGAYHGDTVGAMSVSSRGVFNQVFEPMLFDVDFLPYGDSAAVQDYFRSRGHEVVAAIVEPLIQGAGGMVFSSPEFVRAIHDSCRESEAYFIADEVMTGWGRTGTLFALNQAGVGADFLCLSKGITGGTLPLGITATSQEVYEVFLGSDKRNAFLHGHSYTANPISCAAANATLRIFEAEPIMERVQSMERIYDEWLPRFGSVETVSGERARGGIFAFNLDGSEGGYMDPLGHRVAAKVLEEGVYIRPLGNTVYLMPPYCIEPDELHGALDLILNAVNAL